MDWTPEYDVDVAKALVGKYVLVGITDRERDTDRITGTRQLHGVVVSTNENTGLVIRNPNTNVEFTLPPVTNRFEPAEPGEYQLNSTGEVVSNPDFVCTWSVYAP